MIDPQWTTIEPGEDALDCIVCDKPLANVMGGDATNQPAYGLAWTTHGHWPSPLFDSFGRGHLEISICEECMVAKASRQIAFVPPTERELTNERMTIKTVREFLSDYEDDVTFKELIFRNGSIVSCGLPIPGMSEIPEWLGGADIEGDFGDDYEN